MAAIDSINDEIEAQMLDWANTFIEARKRALQKGRKGVATGDTLNSFDANIEKMARAEGVALVIAFNDAGRLLDMKPSSLQYEAWGRTAITELENWIQKRGLGGFTSGYLRKNPNFGFRKGLNIKRLISNIAWGIAISRTNGKFKRKAFWNKAKTAGVYELINKTAAALPQPALDELKKNLKS